ncbi:MAG TPA: hypothetical protein VGL72_06480 [Bryobacteraceae bacterium]
MAGLKLFPNRTWPKALAVASAAAAFMFTGAVAMADSKPAPHPSVKAPSRPSTPAAHTAGPAAHTTPTHAGPASVPGRAGGAAPGHVGGGAPGHVGGGMPSHNGGMAGEHRPGTGSAMSHGGGAHMGPAHAGSSPGHSFHSVGGGREVASHGGHVSEIRSRDMAIRRGPAGMRRTVVERGGRTYSFNRAGYGHVRSEYRYGGRAYAVRHYYVGGRAFPRYYRSYGYRGLFFDAYAPAFYYSPFYYGWAYRPWAAPIAFGWGWGASPWYGYYGGYFSPYPQYASANLWLTDYIVAQTLQASYQERVDSERAAQMQANNQPPPEQAPLTPEIKQQIAEEVQRQLAAESAEAQARANANPNIPPPPAPPNEPAPYTSVSRMIDDNKTHVLLSSANIDVTTLAGQECSISQGDAIAITPGQAGGQGDSVQVKVLASAGGSCPANSVVTVSLTDVQEMVNHVRATMDSGLAEMQKDPKLPKPPSTVPTATKESDFAAAAPPADPNEAAELTRLNSEATQTEQATLKEASLTDQNAGQVQQAPQGGQPQGGGSTSLQPGMTPEQVIGIMGTPTGNTKFGPKTIMSYPGLKLTFTNGKLTDIQ